MIVAFKDMQQLSISGMTELYKIPQLVSAPFKYHINCIGRDFTRNRLQLEHSYCQLVSVKYHVEEKVTDRAHVNLTYTEKTKPRAQNWSNFIGTVLAGRKNKDDRLIKT